MTIGIYIHVPFCVKKCSYCDFISYPYDAVLAASYLCGLEREISMYGAGQFHALHGEDRFKGKTVERPSRAFRGEEQFIMDRRVSTVYIGGGTPSVLRAEDLERIFTPLRAVFELTTGAEITVEVNPGTVDKGRLNKLRELGCNRLSVGVQSMKGELLGLLGRIHGKDDVASTVRLAREAGFDNINLDLIFGIPGQTLRDWKETLSEVLEHSPEHLSSYNLKIERGTPLAEMSEAGRLAEVNEDMEVEMYYYTIDRLTAEGYRHYEISNFCRQGRESAHNIRYWQNGEYLGLGPAAHSYLQGIRFSNWADIKTYLKVLEKGELPVAERNPTDLRTRASEAAFLGLRMIEGINLQVFQQRFGHSLEEFFPGAMGKLIRLELLEKNNGYLRLTRKGLPLANEVFAEFV